MQIQYAQICQCAAAMLDNVADAVWVVVRYDDDDTVMCGVGVRQVVMICVDEWLRSVARR